mmetsp:Transcript_8715/g.12088  ORF Transcript_8715/g.12088 Transcript_8715/m.12088 type:complete len:253 (+) Transcript_8715:32-790(+)|eukprot:CAMPEP_0197318920 /NCGR_PEP_ID=MMETSP0891-20130614/52761_1 /TAXON_ID=44058 ORGANISM="Aureoumbra lagunensis, Strain CCMP1510" /NCGR_SAMPLE_ID=MMETSP0891 /ASSEMBLY_ACC=CAM_ASM_000534 /LENGTH=252 /DNA_ID=CAMNT_0042809573 /DNA_START=32 /DNA_END=790 /DNA_ORIENTATION=+
MSEWSRSLTASVSAALEGVEQSYSLPSGNRDLPGRARLNEIHPKLDVGNELAASYVENSRPYGIVLSTVTPRKAKAPYNEAAYLSTHEYKWYDACGRETPAGEADARKNIIAAAKALDTALSALPSDGPRALVHCAYGQNRSNAVCVAYAVLYCGWSPAAAIEYARKACVRDRRYYLQKPLHNEVFNRILQSFTPSFDGSGARAHYKETPLTQWLGLHNISSLSTSSLSSSIKQEGNPDDQTGSDEEEQTSE